MKTTLVAETVTFNERQIKAANDDCEEVECSYRTLGNTLVYNRVNKRAFLNSVRTIFNVRKIKKEAPTGFEFEVNSFETID